MATKHYYLDVWATKRLLLGIDVEANNDQEALQKIRDGHFEIFSEDFCDMKVDEDSMEYRYDEDEDGNPLSEIPFKPEGIRHG